MVINIKKNIIKLLFMLTIFLTFNIGEIDSNSDKILYYDRNNLNYIDTFKIYFKDTNLIKLEEIEYVRENDNKIVGMINVRWNLTEEMKLFGGNIGYGIRPTERRKGYNKINLYLGLIEAQKLGLDRVMLDCDVSNLGSSKTMEALGGELERTEIDPYDGILTSVYQFDVTKTIDKYREEYENKIYKREKEKSYVKSK